MNIGIDIDDTITNTWETLMPICAKKFNTTINKLKTLPPYYGIIKELTSLEEYLKLMRECEEIMQEIPLKENVKEILDKLKEEENKIIFITARGEPYDNPYKMTKDYLDKFSIPYDKIIINAQSKGIVCKDVSKKGIEVLMMETYFNEKEKEFIHMKNWNQIYEYIKNR